MRKFDNQSGRSMIEMLGVLAIVGVLSVAGIQGYSKAMAKYKVNKVMDQVSTITANVKTMFASQGHYKDLTTSAALQLGLLPEEMTRNCHGASGSADTNDLVEANYDTCVRNGLNGGVEVGSVTAQTGEAFGIVMNGLTKEACTALATSDWGGASGFRYLAVSNANQALPTAVSSTADNVISPAVSADAAFSVAASKCNCTDTTCSVAWVLY